MDKIVALVRADLTKQFEPFAGKTIGLDDWIVSGTQPKADNYDVFLLRKEGLTLVFNPYRVAPYVFGERRVTVPWTELYEYLTPEWRSFAR